MTFFKSSYLYPDLSSVTKRLALVKNSDRPGNYFFNVLEELYIECDEPFVSCSMMEMRQLIFNGLDQRRRSLALRFGQNVDRALGEYERSCPSLPRIMRPIGLASCLRRIIIIVN